MDGIADSRPRHRPDAPGRVLGGALMVLTVASLLFSSGVLAGHDGTRPPAAEATQPLARAAASSGLRAAPSATAAAPSSAVRLLVQDPRRDRHAAQAYERCFGPTALLLRPPNPPLCLRPPSPWRPAP